MAATGDELEKQKRILQNIDLAIDSLERAKTDATIKYTSFVPYNKGLVRQAGGYNLRAYESLCNVPIPANDLFAVINTCVGSYQNKTAFERTRDLLRSANLNMKTAVEKTSDTVRNAANTLIFVDYITRAINNLKDAKVQAENLTSRDLETDQKTIINNMEKSIKTMTDIKNSASRNDLGNEKLDPVIADMNQTNSLFCNKTVLEQNTTVCEGNWPNKGAFEEAKPFMREAWREMHIARNTESYAVFGHNLDFAIRNLNRALVKIRQLMIKS